MRLYVWLAEKQAGPYPANEIHEFLLAGRIDDQTLCCYEGDGEWQPFEKVRSAVMANVKQIPEDKNPVKTAKRVPYGTQSSRGKEWNLELLGIACLALGIIGAFCCLAKLGDAESSLKPFLIALGISSAFNGVAAYILLSAGAEVIRLLKKLNGLKFDGDITHPYSIQIYRCSRCAREVTTDTTKCPGCGSLFKIEKPQKS